MKAGVSLRLRLKMAFRLGRPPLPPPPDRLETNNLGLKVEQSTLHTRTHPLLRQTRRHTRSRVRLHPLRQWETGVTGHHLREAVAGVACRYSVRTVDGEVRLVAGQPEKDFWL